MATPLMIPVILFGVGLAVALPAAAGCAQARPAGRAASAAAGQAGSDTGARPAARRDAPRAHVWSPFVTMASVYESNINHDVDDLDSYGVVAGAGVGYASASARPAVEAAYEIALHRYSRTDRWDRVSQKARVAYERRVTRRWSAQAAGEVSLKGSSEDREIADQYALSPRVEYRLGGNHRARLYGAYRVKRYPSPDTAQDAVNRYLGAELRRRLEGGGEWRIGYRREANAARGPRFHYTRWVFSTEYAAVIGRRDQVLLDVRYYSQRYPNRTIKIDVRGGAVKVPRHDHRWVPSLVWSRRLRGDVELELGYELQARTSNDPEKAFDAHAVTVGVLRRW